VGVSVCDVGAGSYAAVATLAALVRRAETGEGARVSVSLFDVMVDWLGYFPHQWWHDGTLPARTGTRHPLFCPYGPYPAAGGRLFGLAVLSPEHWNALCGVLERLDLLDDERYATNESRVAHRDELELVLEAELAKRAASEWLERLREAGIPCGDVNDVGEVMEHPQLAHNRLVTKVQSPVGSIPTIGNPFLVGEERPGVGDVPAHGQHTAEVLAELGLDTREA
jgi:crotonobetainyl-CoA:carnitine CoA-transferase CaiB-like acyl-CoA transferase